MAQASELAYQKGAFPACLAVLVIIYLENTREFPEIITSTGAKFWLRFCLSVLVLVIFRSPRIGIRGSRTCRNPKQKCQVCSFVDSNLEAVQVPLLAWCFPQLPLVNTSAL